MLVIRTRAVLSFAILSGLLAYACPRPALAFEATAPLTASSGSVGINIGDCTGDNKALTYASSAFGCNTITGGSGPVKTLKRSTAQQVVPEQASSGTAATTYIGLTGFSLAKEKYYLLGGTLRYTPNAAGADCNIGFQITLTQSGDTTTTASSSIVYLNLACVAGVNKSDAVLIDGSGYGAGPLACDLGTTEDVAVEVSGLVYLTDGGAGTDLSGGTLDMILQGSVFGTGTRTCTYKKNSTIWIEEVG